MVCVDMLAARVCKVFLSGGDCGCMEYVGLLVVEPRIAGDTLLNSVFFKNV